MDGEMGSEVYFGRYSLYLMLSINQCCDILVKAYGDLFF